MANRTLKDAKNIHGTNPQYLVEKIIRSRIYDSQYWKESCFALTAELMVDKAMELRYIGGVFGGNIKPTPFICLILKFLQIQPEKDIVIEFIKNEEFKYVRALGAFYLRLTASAVDCYKYLEPLYNDYRKLRRQNRAGHYEIVHMDEFIDELLREERVCDVILPRIQKRPVLEENGDLDPKVSLLDDDLDEEMPSEDEEEQQHQQQIKKQEVVKYSSKPTSDRRRNRSSSPEKHKKSKDRRRDDSPLRKKYREERRERDRRRSPERERRRSRSAERPRYRDNRDDRHYKRDRSYERDRRRY
jgi:pre-mRNA-splicing factor 38A